MKISSRTTSVVIALLLALSFVAADISVQRFTHEAEFNAPLQETRVCGCGQTTDAFLLTNVGDFRATFYLTLAADEEWIELPFPRYTLDAGESIPVPINIEAPCGDEDVYHYDVYATSQFGRYRAADRDVTVHACQPISFQVEPAQQQILPCTPADFTLTLENTASYEETYTIEADAPVQLERSVVTLRPGEDIEIDATAQWSCDVSGTQHLEFEVDAQRTDVDEERVVTVDILRDYDYQLVLSRESTTPVRACAQTGTEVPLTLRSLADTDNAYSLDLRGPGFASIDVEEASLGAGERRDVTVTLRPEEADVGSHTIVVETESQFGGNQQTTRIPIEVRDCYEQRVEFIPESLIACAGPTNVTVQVQNRGETAERFSLKSDGDIYSDPARNDLWLRSGEYEDVLLFVDIPDRTQEFVVELLVSQTPGLTETHTLPVQAYSDAACMRIEPHSTDLDVYTDVEVVPLLVENTGIRSANYEIIYQGDLFSVDEEEIFLAPGEQGVLHLRATDALAEREGEFLETLFLESPRSLYRYDLSIEVEEKGFFANLRERVLFGAAGGVDWCMVLLVVVTVLALIMLLVLILTWLGLLAKPTMSPNAKEAAAILLAGLAVLLIVGGIFWWSVTDAPIVLSEEPVGSDYGELYHEFVQGEIYELDLARYFSDPDADALTFSSSQPEHLDIMIEDDVARIRAERSFSGQQSVVFTAVDSEGLAVDSPIMTVNVIGKQPLGFWGTVSFYCWPLTLIMLGVLGLLGVAWLFLSANPRMEERYGKPVRAMVVPGSREPATASSEVGPLPPAPGPRGAPTVHGDVVAGDKVTYQGTPKREVFVASKGGKKIHRAECPIAMRISRDRREVFATREEALKAGYSPCRQCRPFDE